MAASDDTLARNSHLLLSETLTNHSPCLLFVECLALRACKDAGFSSKCNLGSQRMQKSASSGMMK